MVVSVFGENVLMCSAILTQYDESVNRIGEFI